MKFKKYVIFFCLIVCLFSIAGVSASDVNSTFEANDNDLIENDVSISSDVLGEGANSDGSLTDLAGEINDATGELNLTRNYAYVDEVDDDLAMHDDGIAIRKEITINGNGHKINGRGMERLFTVYESPVTFNNITITGAGVNFNSNNNVLNNCKIYSRFQFKGSDNILNDCTFTSTVSFVSSNNNVLNNCSFDNCQALDDMIYFTGSNNTFNNCNFENCYAQFGYFIYFLGSFNTMKNCKFEKCRTEDAPMIYMGESYGSGLNVINCSFNNCRSNAEIIICSGSNSIVANCSFANTVVKSKNGEIEPYPSAMCVWGDSFIIANCSFVKTSATGYIYLSEGYNGGGAIRCRGNDGIIANCSFVNTSSFSFQTEYCGGSIYFNGDNGIIYNCSFVNSSSKSRDMDGYGGAIYLKSDNCTVSNCSFESCSATFGGGIYFKGMDCSLIYPTFRGNEGTGKNWFSENPVNVVIVKTSTKIAVSGVNTPYGGVGNLIATLMDVKDNALSDEELVILLNGECYYKTTDSNGQVRLPVYGLDCGSYAADIYYEGTEEFDPSNATANIAVKKANTIISAKDVSVLYKDVTGKLVAKLTDANGKALPVNVNVSLNGKNHTIKADSRGRITVATADLTPGTYTATIFYEGNGNYKPTTAKANIRVNKADTLITASDVTVSCGDPNGKLVATITNAYGKALSVYVNVNLNGIDYAVRADSQGRISIPTEDLACGNYTATLTYAGNGNYKPTTATANIMVDKADTVITAWDVAVAYKDTDGKLVAAITDQYDNPISVNVNANINGKTYTVKADSQGQINIPTADLTPGTYTATISYEGNENYNPATATAQITVNKADTIIDAQDVSLNFTDPDGRLVATLTNAYGKPLAVYVNVTFNGETYAVKANSKGQVIIPTRDLTPKTYTATISYKGNGNYNPSNATAKVTITKTDSVISAPDVSVPYKNTTNQTIATITNAYGKALAVYVNVTVNGEKFVVRANYKGEVSVSTANLAPGTYDAAISYKGNGNYKPSSAATRITVEKAGTVITAPDVSVAYKDANGKLVATITNAYGKAMSVYVNVNLNGVDNTIRADSQGQIFVSTADLAPGTYAATISYKGNGNYKASSTTAQITVNKADTTITASDITVYCGDPDGKLVATITNAYGKALSVYVNVDLNGETYAIRADSQGRIIMPTEGLACGNYTATITYAGNGNYNPSSTTAEIVVADKIDTAISLVYNVGSKELVATLSDADGNAVGGAVVVFNIDGMDYELSTDVTGEAKFSTMYFEPGSYAINVSYAGDGKYNPSSKSDRVIVQ